MGRPNEYDQAITAINATSDLRGQVMHMGGGIEAIEVIHQGVTVIVSGSDAQVFADGRYYVTVEGSSESYQETTMNPGNLPRLIREAVRVHTGDIDLLAEVFEQQYGYDTEVYNTGGGIWGFSLIYLNHEFLIILDEERITVTNVRREEVHNFTSVAEAHEFIQSH